MAAVAAPIGAQAEDRAAPERRAWQLAQQGNALLDGDAAQRGQARQCFEEVLRLDSTWYGPQACVGLAILARLESRPWDGFRLLREAGERQSRLPQEQKIAQIAARSILVETANCDLALGLTDLANVALRRCAELNATASGKERFAAAVAEIDLRLACGEHAAAQQSAAQALRDADLLRSSATAAGDLRMRLLLARRSQAESPADLTRIAHELRDLLAGADLQQSLRQRTAMFVADTLLAAGALPDAADCVRGLLQQPFDNVQREAEILALHARVELARGADRAALVPVRNRLGDAVERLLREWRQMPLREGGYGVLNYQGRRDFLGALLSLDRAVLPGDEAAAAAFSHLESVLALGTVSRRLGGSVVDLAAARTQLVPTDGGMLLHLLTAERAHLLLIDGAGVLHSEVALDAAFWRRAQALRRAALQPPAAEDVSVSTARTRALAQRLASPLLTEAVKRRIASWHRIVLVGEERHSELLQLLPWSDGWLCLEKAIVHVPSTTLAMALQNRDAARRAAARGGGPHLVLVGDPTLDAAMLARWSLQSLDLDDRQRRALLASFAADCVVARVGTAATAAALAEPAVASARALCILTHGVQDYSRECSAGLLLAAPGGGSEAVFAPTLEALQLPPLVLLGVCRAADGPERFGDDGAAHLDGSVLTAGAAAVVSARGKLPVDATVRLLADALREWRSGATAAEALRRARCGIAAKPGWAHPYYFAGLRLVGIDLMFDDR